MSTVLITTDFSAPSRHALDYVCLLAQDRDVTLDLVHIFPIPTTYTSDGLALAAMGRAIEHAEERIANELEQIHGSYPAIKITGRVITGGFLETLREEAMRTRPNFIVLGTAGFTDLYFGETDPLEALRILPVPVLFIPHNAALRPIRNVAYACNYAHVGTHTPTRDIINWVALLGAKLQVIHTDAHAEGVDEKQLHGEQILKEKLQPVNPVFHWKQDPDVVHGIVNFVAGHDIDCVLVVPRKHGFWESFFWKSRTKALARFNKIPVMAFHPVAG